MNAEMISVTRFFITRGGRGGGGRGGKREFERKSGDDKTGVKPVDKREGSGSHNWGTYEDDMKAEQDQANTSTDDAGQADAPANDAANADNEAKTNGDAEKAEEKEKEEVTFTLDEWKKQQGEKSGPKFNVRKAGEGSDIDPKWKKTYAYKKEKETHEDDEDEDHELYPQRSNRQKKILDIEFSFNDPNGPAGQDRGGRGRGGRGGRGGRERRDNDRGDRGERGDRGDRGNRGARPGGRGGFGGKPRGGRGGAEAPNVNDESSFPSLG